MERYYGKSAFSDFEVYIFSGNVSEQKPPRASPMQKEQNSKSAILLAEQLFHGISPHSTSIRVECSNF